MKIGFFVNTFPTLSETFILNQMAGLIELGHDVVVFAESRGNTQKVHDTVERYGLLHKTRYEYLPSGIFPRLGNVPVKLIANIGEAKTLVKSMSPWAFGRDALSLRIFYAACAHLTNRTKDLDVVLCHYGPNGLKALYLRELGLFHAPIATIFHGYDVTKYVKERGVGAYQKLFNQGELLLPISENWRNRLLSLGAPSSKTLVHRMGIDCSLFPYQPRSFAKGRPLRLLSVCRLVEKKGIEFAIRALKKVVDESNVDVRYDVVGDGPLHAPLEALVRELGMQKQIRLLGAMPQAEVKAALNRSDIFLAPSITAADGDQEGIPVVLMEAAAVGLPIVASRHSGIPELVKDGETGVLVEERDVVALAGAIIDMHDRPEKWQSLTRQARSLVEREFDIDSLNRLLSDRLQALSPGRVAV